MDATGGSGRGGQATAPGRRPKIAFLFGGQGTQYPGMGKTLYETQPTFRRALEQCAEISKRYLDVPLLEILFPADPESALIHETAYTQPAMFALRIGDVPRAVCRVMHEATLFRKRASRESVFERNGS